MLLGVKGRIEGLKYNNDFGGRGGGTHGEGIDISVAGKICPLCKKEPYYRSVSTLMSLIVAAQQSDYACRKCGKKGHFQIYFRTLKWCKEV